MESPQDNGLKIPAFSSLCQDSNFLARQPAKLYFYLKLLLLASTKVLASPEKLKMGLLSKTARLIFSSLSLKDSVSSN